MFSVITLSMALTVADPALAGGPLQAPPPPAGTVVIETPCPTGARRVEDCGRYEQSAHRSHRVSSQGEVRRVQSHRSSGYAERTVSTYAAHAVSERRTVTLSDGFFFGGLTGGVERPPTTVYGHGRRVLILGGSHAPQSAGQAAAARGLGRSTAH